MTLPFNPVKGDVLKENNGTEWVVIQELVDTDSSVYWVKTETSPAQYRTILPADHSKFTKKEPIFEVGKQYSRVDGTDSIIYTVAVVDGLNVLVWWNLLMIPGARGASWIKYEERKNFVEVGRLK